MSDRCTLCGDECLDLPECLLNRMNVLRAKIRSLETSLDLQRQEHERLNIEQANVIAEKSRRVEELTEKNTFLKSEVIKYAKLAGETEAKLSVAETTLTRLRGDRERIAEYILLDAPRRNDHACSRCIPWGLVVQPGFSCGFHLACDVIQESMQQAGGSSAAQEEHKDSPTKTALRGIGAPSEAKQGLEARCINCGHIGVLNIDVDAIEGIWGKAVVDLLESAAQRCLDVCSVTINDRCGICKACQCAKLVRELKNKNESLAAKKGDSKP